MRVLHIGRKVPKELEKAGYEEVGAIHLGFGCWILSLEKKNKNTLRCYRWRAKYPEKYREQQRKAAARRRLNK